MGVIVPLVMVEEPQRCQACDMAKLWVKAAWQLDLAPCTASTAHASARTSMCGRAHKTRRFITAHKDAGPNITVNSVYTLNPPP